MELKTPLPQHPIKELIAEVAKIETLAIPASANAKRESETSKTMSSKSSPQRMSTRKMKKEPTPELSEEEEEAKSSKEEIVDSSDGEPKLEDEAEPAIPPLEEKKRWRHGLLIGRIPPLHSRPRSLRRHQQRHPRREKASRRSPRESR